MQASRKIIDHEMCDAGQRYESGAAHGAEKTPQEGIAHEVASPAGTRTCDPRRTAHPNGPQSCSRQSCSEHLTQ